MKSSRRDDYSPNPNPRNLKHLGVWVPSGGEGA